MPLEPVDAALAERYAALGVDRLVLRPQAFDDAGEVARYLERHAHLGGT